MRPRVVPLCRLLLLSLLLLALLGGTQPARAKDAPAPSAIQALVDGLKPYVAQLRGLAWKEPVPAQVLSRAQLGELLKSQLDRDVTPAEWARDTRILRRLGMLQKNEDIKSLMMSMFQAGIEGLYDPETRRMYVVEGFRGDAVKPTIVHELIHALEDQHLDLDEMEDPYRDHDPDRVFAIRCLMEGGAEYARRRYMDDARAVAAAYYQQQGGTERDQRRQLAMMKRVPAHMMISSLLHYRIGPNFVGDALFSRSEAGANYAQGMARLYADPPTTEEQCLYPYKWLGEKRDYPRTVEWSTDLAAVMGPGWSRFDEHTVGELDLAIYLDYFLGGRQGRLNPNTLGEGFYVCALASRAARGWDAGRAYYLRTPGDTLTVVQVHAFDSSAEAREASRFLAAALHKANGKTWKGQGWKGEESDAGSGRHYDYLGRHGHGRVAQLGQSVLILDGCPEGTFEKLWPHVAATRFLKDARDFGDELEDPFAGHAVVDRRRGLGLKLPGRHWTADEGDGASPLSFASARSASVEMDFVVYGQEHAQAGLPEVGKMILGRMFNASNARPAQVMGQPGIVHGLPAAPGQKGWLYIASDLARTYVMTVRGSAADVERLRADIALLLKGCGWNPPADSPEAGLRSIPGY